MIDLTSRGFAPAATVLSFIADMGAARNTSGDDRISGA
jgi:hypothetical protein